ncbi:MAG: hypothetical protein L0Z53_11405 [Acidobacteriales bacterium]|nr:hypothetical protein [Terriglobales bacterium]
MDGKYSARLQKHVEKQPSWRCPAFLALGISCKLLAEPAPGSMFVGYGLAGLGGFGHCGCDGVDIHMANDAVAAVQVSESFALRMFFVFQPFLTAVNHFSRAQGRKTSDRSQKHLKTLQKPVCCDTLPIVEYACAKLTHRCTL